MAFFGKGATRTQPQINLKTEKQALNEADEDDYDSEQLNGGQSSESSQSLSENLSSCKADPFDANIYGQTFNKNKEPVFKVQSCEGSGEVSCSDN